MAQAASIRPPLWRDVRVLRVVGQIALVLAVVLVVREMYLNATFQLDAAGRDLSYSFLDNRAGFGIKESIVQYSQNNDFARALLVAATNAIVVALSGIVLATILGTFIGILRLSPNWLLRKITQVYVEVIRNTPALLQIIFWYVAVILAIPRLENSISLFGLGYISNRGAAIPTMRGGDDFGTWGLFVLGGLVAAFLVRRWRTKIFDETGQPHYRFLWSTGTFLAIVTIGYLLLGDAFSIETPEVGRRNLVGGIRMSPEFAGVLIGLTVYTAAFIGEIVRGSILAVSKGQKEAAEALGLSPAQQLRYVVLPQAMRVAIPPITNQYLNLWKNTSLAFAVGYPEVINISGTIVNQAQHPLEVFSIVIGIYLAGSLVLSLVMNIVNRSVALKGAR
ncbi:MAG: ABC transporter permease subunit [Actinomycetota bacterium]|nr:ABC transporter permease subunit [Actinomycetota bacterium]